MSGTLYVVATPIGNKADISERALNVLREADIIAAEDTRTTQNLLHLYGITGRTVSNHKFNEQKQKDFLLSCLKEGKNIAVVSDAGTPCISDPGYVIIHAAAAEGISVIGVCGANAVVTALSVSGFDCSSYAFHGFLPRKDKELERLFGSDSESAVRVNVYYESPKRIKKSLQVLSRVSPSTEVCLCNDLTKLYERTYRGTPETVLQMLTDNPDSEKGEYTLIVAYPEKKATELKTNGTAATPEALLVDYMITHNVSAKQAIAELSGKAAPKKELYNATLHLKQLFGGES